MGNSKPQTKIVFLYTEIAGYFLACAERLSEYAEVLIVRWPINKEAPFQFDIPSRIKVLDKSTLSESELRDQVKSFNPDLVVCSGWIDKTYVNIARSFRKKIPVVISLDNHWKGTLKQRLAAWVSPIYLKRIFTHAWVPGKPQAEFARKLGFGDHILTDFYCADIGLFQPVFERTFPAKREKFPRRFLYVARYVEHKGIFELWEAFRQLREETNTDWELWCIGTGDRWEERVEVEGIKHFGFVQPADLEPFIGETGVYILPSKFEPWGVTVQEFAACGFPMLLSNEVGASSRFLSDNGYGFKAGSVNDLKEKMKLIIGKPESELIQMGLKSNELGTSLNPEIWAKNILQLVKK